MNPSPHKLGQDIWKQDPIRVCDVKPRVDRLVQERKKTLRGQRWYTNAKSSVLWGLPSQHETKESSQSDTPRICLA